MKAIVSGIEDCPVPAEYYGSGLCSNLNGTHILAANTSYSPYEGYYWRPDVEHAYEYRWQSNYGTSCAFLVYNPTDYNCMYASESPCQADGISGSNEYASGDCYRLDNIHGSYGYGGSYALTPCDEFGNDC